MSRISPMEYDPYNADYVGLWPRFTALFIDLIIFCLFFFPATKMIKGTWLMMASDHDWNWGAVVFDPICLSFLIIMFLYYVILEAYLGYTPGKRIAGIKVIAYANGKRPGLMASLLRNLGRLIDGLPALNILGIYLILTSPEKARMGDRIAGTRVIKQ